MKPEEQIFAQAIAILSVEAREAYLLGACGNDSDLRQRVDELLAGFRAADQLAFLPAGSPANGITVSESNSKGQAPGGTLLASAAQSQPAGPAPGTVIGRYILREQIGEGGCGIVYVAEQQEPIRRKVALKIIKPGMDSRSVLARFDAERQALAMMDHPNIAKVLDAGTTEAGHPFFVMELVRGVKITDYCDQARLSSAQRLELFVQVCGAVQHAHQKAIIHRDLKPSNILVTLHDGVPVPKVIDFGIAKALVGRLTDLTVYTELRLFLGTPAYMSPEQAEMSGLDVDTRSDIYSLGVLLYELLTGTTPFGPKELLDVGLDEMRRTLREKEPVRPSTRLRTMMQGELTTTAQQRRTEAPKLIHLLRGDLDWIVMKCLEKDRTRRYETAIGLAMDLKRYLQNEPVLARPPSAAYRLQKAWRRNKVVGTAASAVALALVVGSAVSAWQAVRATRAQRAEAIQSRLAQSRQKEAEKQRQRAESGEASARRYLYAANMSLAQKAWDEDNVPRLRELLKEAEHDTDRGFEWYYWQQQIHLEKRTLYGHIGRVDAVAFFPDGQSLVSAGKDRIIRIWSASTGEELRHFEGHLGLIYSVAVSPDGQRLATGSWDYTAKLWDPATGERLATLPHRGAVWAVGFSPDGRWLATGSSDHLVRVWDVTTGKESFTLAGHSDGVISVCFSPEGDRLVSGGWDGTVKIWNLTDRSERLPLTGHSAPIRRVTFSPDGRRILSSDRAGKVIVSDADTGAERFALEGHRGSVECAVFSPDGKRIATAGGVDQTIRLWKASNGDPLLVLKGHTAAVRVVAFAPDGKWLASGSLDGTIKLWCLPPRSERLILSEHGASVASVAFSPEGRWALTAGADHTAKVWDLAVPQALFSLRGHGDWINPLGFSADGRRIFAVSADGIVQSWDAANGTPMPVFRTGQADATAAAVSPDGRRVAIFDWTHVGTIRDTATGANPVALRGHTGRVWAVAFSPDGRQIVTASEDRTARLWDVDTGQPHPPLKGHTAAVRTVAFSPDGQRVLTAGVDWTARVWDARAGAEVVRLEGHTGSIWAAAWSPDGRRILTGSEDGAARVWDAASGRTLLTLAGHSGAVLSVAFSPDGRRVLTGTADGTARMWEAATPEAVQTWADTEQADRERLLQFKRQRDSEQERQQAARARDPGAIKEWLILAPIRYPSELGTAEAVDQKQLANEGRLHPAEGERVELGGKELVWRAVRQKDYILDFNAFLGEGTSWPAYAAYAVAYIHSDREQRGLRIKLGNDTMAKLYLNGQELYCMPFHSPWVPEVASVEGVSLRAGMNVLEFKVLNVGGQWMGCVRFTDADGHPVQGIRVTLDPSDQNRR